MASKKKVVPAARTKSRAMRKKKAAKRDPNNLDITATEGTDQRLALARTVRRPTVQAMMTLREWDKANFSDLDITAMVEALTEQTVAAVAGDTSRGQAMLVAQAHTLDAIFNNLAQRTIASEYMKQFEPYLKLALRAQSQCRATWEALSAIQNPPVAGYVNQANIAHGPQQVNNDVPGQEPSRTAETQNAPTELLEETDGEWLDTGATGAAGGVDTALEAVGEIDRTSVSRG